MSAKPNFLVLGGLGFIGRNLVEYLVENNLAGKIRVADKVVPELVALTEKQSKIFKGPDPVVDFRQANLARESSVKSVFDTSEYSFDYVINLAGETKYGQTPEVYKENIFDLSVNVAKAAAAKSVKRLVEVSTCQVYSKDKAKATEDSKTDPWTKLGQAKLDAEQELKKIPNLNYVIVRPAIVYGPGDMSGITPRLICAAVYKQLGETMEFLWDADLHTNTVHVEDVVAAIVHLTTHGNSGDIFNLVDSNDTDQGIISKHLEHIFGIKTSFMGSIQSKVATSLAASMVTETANEKHLKPWGDLCKAKNITNTPLTPFLDEELLYHNPYYVDGTKITKTGFNYKHPKLEESTLRQTIQGFISLGYFPDGVI